jgi:hypothetical protein
MTAPSDLRDSDLRDSDLRNTKLVKTGVPGFIAQGKSTWNRKRTSMVEPVTPNHGLEVRNDQ